MIYPKNLKATKHANLQQKPSRYRPPPPRSPPDSSSVSATSNIPLALEPNDVYRHAFCPSSRPRPNAPFQLLRTGRWRCAPAGCAHRPVFFSSSLVSVRPGSALLLLLLLIQKPGKRLKFRVWVRSRAAVIRNHFVIRRAPLRRQPGRAASLRLLAVTFRHSSVPVLRRPAHSAPV